MFKTILYLTVLLSIPTQGFSETYYIDRSIDDGYVFGTITTDGTVGELLSENFLDWDLEINDGIGSFSLTSQNSFLIYAQGGFSATETNLFYDFSGDGQFGILTNIPQEDNDLNSWGLQGEELFTGALGAEVITIRDRKSNTKEYYAGEQIVAGISEVPLPAAAWFFGSALAGLAGIKRKK